jgi:hypothetical protein
MSRRVYLVFLAMVLTAGTFGTASGYDSDLDTFNTKYGTQGTALDTCNLCHPKAKYTALNAYGKDYADPNKGDWSYNKILEDLDSDGDGFTNIAEINARTFPGDKKSRPVVDKQPPKITVFKVLASSGSLTVPITDFEATDNVGVTGYLFNESSVVPSLSDPMWIVTVPTHYVFASIGKKTLYAWARDAAGNVSKSKKAKVNVTGTLLAGTDDADVPSQEMLIWTWVWFEVTVTGGGDPAAGSGQSPDRASAVRYLKISSWDPGDRTFRGNLYGYDEGSGQWLSDPLVLHYLSGSPSDFLCWSYVAGDPSYSFTARVRGMVTDGYLKSASVETLGGYSLRYAGNVGSGGARAGWLVLTGTLIPESEVPVP